MKSHLEFVSAAFPALPEEAELVNPGRYGKRLAEYLASELQNYGFRVTGINPEDWGWRIDLENSDFPLWIGCGNQGSAEGFLCFLEPSRPFVRRLLIKIPTIETIERLAEAMQAIFERSGKVQNMRWWTDDEIPPLGAGRTVARSAPG